MKRTGLLMSVALLAFVLSSLTGCRKYEQIRITSGRIESVSMNGFKAVDLSLVIGVDNPAGKVVVKNAEGTLKHFGKVIGKVSLAPLTLMPRSVAEHTVKAHVELDGGVGFKNVLGVADPRKWDEYTVDIMASGRASGIAVKKNINDIPLKKLLEDKINEKI